jgi:hypothetical protein
MGEPLQGRVQVLGNAAFYDNSFGMESLPGRAGRIKTIRHLP